MLLWSLWSYAVRAHSLLMKPWSSILLSKHWVLLCTQKKLILWWVIKPSNSVATSSENTQKILQIKLWGDIGKSGSYLIFFITLLVIVCINNHIEQLNFPSLLQSKFFPKRRNMFLLCDNRDILLSSFTQVTSQILKNKLFIE